MASGATLPRTSSKWSPSGVAVVVILALASAVAARFLVHYAVPYFGFDAKYYDYYWPHRFRLIVHISGGIVALVCGTRQLWTGLRQKAMRFHRWTGRVYLAGVSVGIVGAFLMSVYTTPKSFAVALRGLSIAWLLTTAIAYAAILRGRVQMHKEWMVRSYIITFAFVTFRLMTEYLPGLTFLNDRNACVNWDLVEDDVAPDPAYAAGCWRERRAAFDGRKRKGKMGNENDRLNSPPHKVVMQNVQIRRSVFEDGPFHFRVRGSTILDRIGLDWLFN